MAKDTNVKLTVDTENINESNKEQMVIFSDDREEDPSNYSGSFKATVDKNQEIIWEAIAMTNSADEVSVTNVSKTGGSDIIDTPIQDPNNRKRFKAKVKNQTIVTEEDYQVTIKINGADTYTLDPKLIMNN